MTNEQTIAINTVDKSIVISANAGSGKTSTMVNRLVSIIQNKLANIDEILALTFTRSAATEMKQRLEKELQKLIVIDKSNKKELEKQLNELNIADICSLDSFCQKLIKKYFYVINVDPNFNIIDEVESGFLKAKALENTLIEYGDKKDFKFLTQALKDNKKFDNITNIILKFAEFLSTLVDYNKYLDNLVDSKKIFDVAINYLLDGFKKNVIYYQNKFDIYNKTVEKNNYEILKNNVQLLLKFCNLFNNYDYNEMKNLKYFPSFEAFPRTRKGREIEELDLQSKINEDIKNFVDDLKFYLITFCFGNLKEVEKHYNNSQKIVNFICEMTRSYINKYQSLKQNKNVLDFTDLEDYVIVILQNENVQKQVMKNYKFVCVDEFQDTNEKQSVLLSYICGENNSFFVGDAKQSIYNFRQCDLNIFVNLIESYKNDASKLFLSFNQNFRSHKLILEFVNKIFDKIMIKDVTNIDYQNENRFDNLKSLRLKFKGTIKKGKKVNYIDRVKIFVLDRKINATYVDPIIKKKIIKKVAVINKIFRCSIQSTVYSVIDNQNNRIKYNFTNEGEIACQYIKSFFEKKIKIIDPITKCKRDVEFNDFVILVRSRTHFQMFIDELNKNSVPVSAKYKFNLIDMPHIKALVNILRCVSNYKQDFPLSTSLKLIGGFNEEDFYTIRQKYPDGFMYEAVLNYLQNNNENDFICDKLQTFFDKLNTYVLYSKNFSVSNTLKYILRENNLYNYFLSQEDGKNLLQQINLFIAKLEHKSFDDNLDEFLQFIDGYKKSFEVDYSTVSSENCVKITTIHDSKGLEFPITIIGNCGSNYKLSQKTDFNFSKELGAGYLDVDLEKRVKYSTIVNSAIYKQKLLDELLEEMRILYVALTRPKEYLALIGVEREKRIIDNYNITKCRSIFDFILNI